MLRRSLSTLVAIAAALTLAAPAAAIAYHVRVEGKTQTIFGATEPRFASVDAGRATALDALEAASIAGEFFYAVQVTQFGPYVNRIGRYEAAGSAGWVFKVNGVLAPVGADQVVLKDGDRVLWYWASFGAAGGPETLALRRVARRCYRITAQNDQGVERPAEGATLTADGRRFPTRSGRACLPHHTGLVRATLEGAVRSNAVR